MKCNSVYLSKPYKNDVQSISKLLRAYLQYCLSDDVGESLDKTFQPDMLLPSITMFGSGGNPRKTDSYGMDIQVMDKTTPLYTCPVNQKSNYFQNSVLIGLTERMACVAVFLDIEKWSPFFDNEIVEFIGEQSDSCLFWILLFLKLQIQQS